MVSYLATVGMTLALAFGADGQLTFEEVGSSRGFLAYVMEAGMGGGAAAADFDDDGDVDLFVPNAEGVADQLYRNLGNGAFEEIADAVGLASLERGRVALWLDVDGDRRLDLLVAGDCWPDADACVDQSTLRLYRQTAATAFADITVEAGLDSDLVTGTDQHRGGLAAGDVDNDGDLDLWVGLWEGQARLFLNDSDGNPGVFSFTEISVASGIGGQETFHWQPMMHDFNGDLRLDIYSAIDFQPNHLWINQGTSLRLPPSGGTSRGAVTFLDLAPAAGADNAWNDMGMTLGDYDNDGDFDVYVTNIERASLENGHNLLLRNDSDAGGPAFTAVSVDAGVARGGWGWGTSFLDADNDGDLDIAATNGFGVLDYDNDASKLFLNQGGDPVTFADVSDATGFNDTYWGSSLLAFDCDRDGDLDLVQTTQAVGPDDSQLRLLDNLPDAATAANHHLVVQPRMAGANPRAIGAVVRVEAGDRSMIRLISAGTSFMGQEPAEAFFGLGDAARAARVVVDWPDGRHSVLAGVAAGQVRTIDHSLLFADGFETGDLSGWQ